MWHFRRSNWESKLGQVDHPTSGSTQINIIISSGEKYNKGSHTEKTMDAEWPGGGRGLAEPGEEGLSKELAVEKHCRLREWGEAG